MHENRAVNLVHRDEGSVHLSVAHDSPGRVPEKTVSVYR